MLLYLRGAGTKRPGSAHTLVVVTAKYQMSSSDNNTA